MALTFPKDEELFLDLDTVRVERATAVQDREFHIYGDEECFGKAFRDVIKEWYSYRYRMRSNDLFYEINMVEELINQCHKKLEKEADQYAEKKVIGSFPKSYIGTRSFKDESGSKLEKSGEYFERLDKATSFMKGIGRVGEFLAKAKEQLDIIAKKGKFIGMLMWMLLVGAVLLLASAEAVDFLPTFFKELMENDLQVRIIVCGGSVLSAGLLFLLDPLAKAEEKGKRLIKAFSNKVFLAVVAAGAFLLNLRVLFSGPTGPYNPYFLLPFGIFYLLYAVIIVFNRMIDVRRAKKAFCTLVDENIQHMHRYIRFHALWWEAQNPGKEHCSGIRNLQESFDHLVSTYKRYK